MTFLKLAIFSVSFSFLPACQNTAPKTEVQPEKKDTAPIPTPGNIISPATNLDASPMDMIYYPMDYPVLKMTNSISEAPVARVIYSRPQVQGRKIFEGLLKYGMPWRLGANEATEIQFYRSVTIQGKNIPEGRYIMYCIPDEKTWTIVLNSNLDSWGLRMDQSKDLFKFIIPSIQTTHHEEYFTMKFEKTNHGMNLVMNWDDIMASVATN